MKTSFLRRWSKTLRGTKQTGRVSRARSRRQHLGLEELENRITLSLVPQMVLDINTNTPSSNPSGMVAIGSTAFFTADDGVHGVELWKSDGTKSGTMLVKEIYPGNFNGEYGGEYPGNFRPSNLTNVNGTLFFRANDGTHGSELWKSDGTAAGTVLVKDANPGSAGSSPRYLTNVNGVLYFSAQDGTTGPGLWKSDGTAAGTMKVKGIGGNSLTNVNGTLFFVTSDGTHGRELWKSDGTAAGTVQVKDIYPGSTGSEPRYLTNVNGTLFFSTYTQASGGSADYELWKSDGTAAGTVLVKDINPGSAGSSPTSLTNVNGTLFFSAYNPTTYWELWKSDGTAAGTVLVKDINPGTGSYPTSLTNVNGTLFFTAYEGTSGEELWKSDGTASGTVLVKDANPGSAGSSPRYLTNVNGTLFFTAYEGTSGEELWKSDGTASGTVVVKDIYPGSAGTSTSLTNVNGTLFFSANDFTHGAELWKSNGTASGTTLVKDINTISIGSNPRNQTDVNGTLFFSADDGMHGFELWKSDGTVAGTALVKDIFPGGYTDYYGGYWPHSSLPSSLTNVNGTLFFTASGGLWKSDGTEAGTSLVAGVGASNLTNVNGTLFFTAGDPSWGSDGVELWKSDGTTSGTVMVKDIFPGRYRGAYSYYPNSSFPSNLTKVSGTLFFTANGGNGRELWKSDGTASGTVLVKDANPGSAGSSPRYLTNVNGTLFFTAYEGTSGEELWKSDGTASGTVVVKDIYPGTNGSYPDSLTDVNGTLFFTASGGLWKSDGTEAGTSLVAGVGASNLTNVNGMLFFRTDDGTHGLELWKSNGTAAGTTLVKDINPGSAVVFPGGLTNVNGTLLFSANDGTEVWKLWQSDGTAAGTVVVANLAANGLSNVNGTLFFSADDGIHGWELWDLIAGPGMAVSGFPATITAGVAGSFTVTAKNADGSTNNGYRGTVHFSSSDPQAVLPDDYTFTAADLGVHTFSATLKTAGSQSITAGDTVVPGGAGTQSGITVNPAAASSFAVAGFPSPVTAGVAGSLTVTAWDAYGNRATGYTGTVHFTSSDAKAVLPGNYTFTAADAGMHSFSATLKTAGYQSLTATDTANGALTDTQGSILVNAAAASRLVLSAPAIVNAGAKFSLTVTVVDAYGNVATGYRGTIAFSSSNATANLPRNYTFTAADQGMHTFTGLVLKKKGKQTITVTDTLDSSLTASVLIDVL